MPAASDPAETNPLYPNEGEQSKGWRLGVAAALRAIETVQDPEECRRQVAALAEAGPPWQRVLGR